MQLKFITLNLWHGGELFDKILEFLHKERPDILVSQEVYDGQDKNLERNFRAYSVLKKELDFKYSSFAPTLIDNRKEGNIVNGDDFLFVIAVPIPVFIHSKGAPPEWGTRLAKFL